MSRRRKKRHADATVGLAKARAEKERAEKELLVWAGRLGVARERIAYYEERIRRQSPHVIVSRAIPGLVDRIKVGARELADQVGAQIGGDT